MLLPFVENEYGISERKTLLKSCLWFDKPVYVGIVGLSWTTTMYVAVHISYVEYFENMFYSLFATSWLQRTDTMTFPKKARICSVVPDASYAQTKKLCDIQLGKWENITDPLKDLFALFATVDGYVWWQQFEIRCRYKKITTPWYKRLAWFLAYTQDDIPTQENCELSMYYITPPKIHSQTKKNIADACCQYMRAFFGTSKVKKWYHDVIVPIDLCVHMFHLPKDYDVVGLKYARYKTLPPPSMFMNTLEWHWSKSLTTLLWKTDYRNNETIFGIQQEDKLRHMYILGKTWTWKSTFLSNLVVNDIVAGHGVCLIDPHGDLVETCLQYIPKHRLDDVVLFDVGDTDFPIGFNMLSFVTDQQKNLIASWVVSAFHKLFAHSRWPRLEYILRNVLLTLIECPDATLLHILRILTDDDFRKHCLWYVDDPLLLKFWTQEYGKRNDKQRQEAIGPIVNKIGQFLSSWLVRHIFGQARWGINLRQIMDSSKILLINLSKWKIWEDNAAMIWSLLVTKLQIDAMSRADIHISQRKDFYVYIDEFQNFATDSFATILSEARKYKLSLILAHQYISQLSDDIRQAIFGNVGTIVSFAVWHDDARCLADQYKNKVSVNDLLSLPRFCAYIKMMIHWQTQDPFSMKTLPLVTPSSVDGSWLLDVAEIIQHCRATYAIAKHLVQESIKIRYQESYNAHASATQQAIELSQQANKSENMHVSDYSSLRLDTTYTWFVKLKYNYWIFVIVAWVEWLCHKKNILTPINVWSRKDVYHIWDSVRVCVDRLDIKQQLVSRKMVEK